MSHAWLHGIGGTAVDVRRDAEAVTSRRAAGGTHLDAKCAATRQGRVTAPLAASALRQTAELEDACQ